jgi:cardiolipin synthase
VSAYILIVIWMLLGAAVSGVYLIFTHRRNTPYLKLELDNLPPLTEGLATLAGLTEGAVYQGNAVTVLQNGSLFPAMQADIEAAQHTVHLETFVWTKGMVEEQFVQLLCRKVKQGVKVRLLVDAMGGSGGNSTCFKRLCDGGVELSHYCQPRWINLKRFNHRTHRKLLIVDGSIGYTFGHGIADQWLGQGQDKDHWRDTAVRVEGPAVHGLQAVFMENWVEETHCIPAGPGCFPVLKDVGTVQAHVFSSASGDSVSSVALVYTVAIASARKEVVIQNPYFVPNDGVCELLGMMVKRGVTVHLMVPGKHTDSPFVRDAGCYLYEALLRAGVHVYEFAPTLLHQKIVIVDGIWSHVGSTNFDSRSLALNEEVGIGVLDERIATELRSAFEADLRHSSELHLQAWRHRPVRSRAWSWLAYRLHAQL